MSLIRNSSVFSFMRDRHCLFLSQALTAKIHSRPPRHQLFQENSFLASLLKARPELPPIGGKKFGKKFPMEVVDLTSKVAVESSTQELSTSPEAEPRLAFPRDLSQSNVLEQVPDTSKANLVEGSFDYESHFENMLMTKKRDQSYRYFKKIERKGKAFPKASEHTDAEKQVVVWCSNDYMGMSWNQDVINAAKSAIDLQGTGSGGTRNISGNLILHETLEGMMASQHGKEAALVFSSCYVANQWTLYSLGRYIPNCTFFCDASNHASLIQGVVSSRAPKVIYEQNSLADLERKLKAAPIEAPKVVVFESVHSMTGSLAPIEATCDLAHRYGALVFLDEVHAVGLYGARGAGAAEELGCAQKVDIVSGTFGKAYGNLGGYMAGSSAFVDFVRSYASGFIFTTSLSPPMLAGALTAVRKLAGEEGRQLRAKQRRVVEAVRSRLLQEDIPVRMCPTHIIPVHVGDPGLCLELSNELLNTHGIYVQAINFPTVARGKEGLRIAPTPHHSMAEVERLVTAMKMSWKKLGGPRLSEL